MRLTRPALLALALFAIGCARTATAPAETPAPAPSPAKSNVPSNFDAPISLNLQNVPAREAIDQIARMSRLNVILNTARPDTSTAVTVSFKEVPAGEALELVAKLIGYQALRVEKHNIVRIEPR